MSVTPMSVEDANALLTIIRSGNNDQAKIEKIIVTKQQIKHQKVDSEAIATVFSALRIGIASSNNTLFQHCFSCLGHLIKRVKNQDIRKLRVEASDLLPILLDKTGDAKDKIRELAMQPLIDMWSACPADVERIVREQGFTHRNPRIRESSLDWLLRVYEHSPDLSVKPFTSLLVDTLEDANDVVREKAKDVVVELFRYASGPAKADLKKSMQAKNVRKAIFSHVMDHLNEVMQSSTITEPVQPPKLSRMASGKGSTTDAQASFLSTLPGVALEEIKPAYVNTSRELDHELSAMLPDFEGRESEANWANRENHVSRLREMLRGNAPKEYEQVFLAGIKNLTDGIVKAMTSLRTKLSTSGCQLLKDLFLVCGSGMDPMVDILLPALVKLCAGTKKITAENGNVTTAILFAKVSYHTKILNQLWFACQDKNVQPRQFASGWLRALLEAHVQQKSVIEHGEGITIIERCLKKGLIDANPGVREGMRLTFWKFHSIWPERGNQIFEAQDANTQKLLEKDNPSKSEAVIQQPRPANPGRSATIGPPTRPSIKELLAAKRRDLNVPSIERSQSHVDTASHASSTSSERPSGSAPLRATKPAPPRPKSQLGTRSDELRRPPSSSSNGDSVGAIEKNVERMNLGKTSNMSSSLGRSTLKSPETSRVSSQPKSPTLNSFRNSVLQSPNTRILKKLTILEQLNHSDHKIRLEGVVIVGCLLAKRTPPHYEPDSKIPSLPPSDQLAQALQSLLNDSHQEVVESVLAPEILGALVQYVGFDQVVPKVLLINEGDVDHPRSDPTSSLVALKVLLTEVEAAEYLFRVILATGSSGNIHKLNGPKAANFTSMQKKKILHGALVWMNELALNTLDGQENYILEDPKMYGNFIDKLIPMLNSTKSTPANYSVLATLLQTLRSLDEEAFEQKLSTFDHRAVKDLRRAWGGGEADEKQDHVEEQVADVRQVLGNDPSFHEMLPPAKLGQPNTEFGTQDEELTMINPMAALYPSKTAQPTPGKSHEDRHDRAQISPDIPDLLSSAKRSGNIDKESVIQVYQDPIQESDEPHTIPEKYVPVVSTKSKTKNTTTNGKTTEQHARTLETLLRRLKSGDIDTHGLRKLAGVVRDNPVRTALQESNGDGLVHNDIWEAGVSFEDLLAAVMKYIMDDNKDTGPSIEHRAQALLLLKQLVNKSSPYFRNHEIDILPPLIQLRGRYPTQSHVSTNIDEVTDDYLNIAEPLSAISTILALLLKSPTSSSSSSSVSSNVSATNANGNANTHAATITSQSVLQLQPQSRVLALTTLSTLIKNAKSTLLEGSWGKLGTIAVRSMDDEDPEVRRSCVNMCVEMRGKLSDDERLFANYLSGLSEGHRNLLVYYFARSK